MKRILPLFLAVAIITSCEKKIDTIKATTGDYYSKWGVSAIKVNSIVYPAGIVWDTTYRAQPTDYADFSKKGTIDFYINGVHHIDAYDTTKFDLLKDTSVAIGSELGFHSVSLHIINSSDASIKESTFGIDAGTETLYTLHR